MAKLRINGDSSGYVDLEAPNAASSSTLDLDQVPQKNAANTFSAVNKFDEYVAIGGTHSPSNNLDVRSTGQAIVRVDGSGLYYNGIKIRNNYSSVQSDWNVGAAGGTSGWGSANGTFIIRDDTTNSTGLEIEQGAGSNTAALHIDSSGRVTTPSQISFSAWENVSWTNIGNGNTVTTLDQTNFNVGNAFNISNNVFTAPVAGKYLFSIVTTLKWGSGSGGNYNAFFLRKNGSAIRGRVRATSPSTNGWSSWAGSWIVDMAVNDTIEGIFYAEVANQLQYNGQEMNFSGYLLG